ncbi:TadE/TadG family type IV pilus assembly protein [Nocardioides sp. zg-1230]|uniref:TadE/TadG family type IV pilus assembly protein n=1 Tax=Nocardioides sp. zg-1230 TaxID=2736601 RepID=UPI001556B824|nr:TadE family protein [Nocardioides sp. zg-1230]NPC43550.1 pilus assembly protein [Nocardioides sp. zg-1230]
MRWRIRNNGRTERGAAAVEFAFVVIPLLFIICMIVNFGVIFAQQLSLDNATRAAARAGVVDTDPPADVSARAEDEFASTIARTSAGDLDITFPGDAGDSCEGSEFGDMLAVRAEVTTDVVIPWIFPDAVLPDSFDLESEAAFQCEFN